MTLAHLAWRYVCARPIVTSVSILGLALGSALISVVLTLHRETEDTFKREAALFDLIVGAKGSPLQLTLSALYHLDVPTGNIPYERYEALRDNPRVAFAVPIGLGDNYEGFRIVGTEQHFFDLVDRESEKPLFGLAEGDYFKDPFDVVLGSTVARETGLKVGEVFSGTHGLVSVPGSEVHTDFPYRVTGILNPTGTSQDRAIFGTLQSVWDIHDKEAAMHDRIKGIAPDKNAPRETTAVLVQLKARGLRLWVADEIRNETEAMPAIPINEILRLYQQVLAPIQRLLLGVAGIVVVVAGLAVLATLYQAVERRRRDLAVTRCLGAHRREVLGLVLWEAGLLGAAGVLLGWLLGHGALALVSGMVRVRSGLQIDPWTTSATEWQTLGLVFVTALLAGLIPALLSYRRSPLNDLALSE